MEENEFKQLFWLLFEAIPDEKVKILVRDGWRKIGAEIPYICSHRDSISHMKPLHYAATDIVGLYFDLEMLTDKKHSLIEVVYHEIAHCYCYAKGSYLMIDYREKPLIKRLCESDAINLSRRWLTTLQHKPKLRKPLETNSLIVQASKSFCLDPLVIKNSIL